ncbi:MAG: TIM barrel protein [Armatimonadetes bacterium]|nr:TIM barrel protein [Armatimonadota bacterium]
MAAIKLSACIEMIYNQVPEFPERIVKVADCGLPAFEFWGWKNKDLDAICAKAKETGMTLAGFSCESVGALVDPTNTRTWIEGAKESILKAKEVGVPTLIVTTGNAIPDVSMWAQHDSIVSGLRGIAPFAEEQGITLVLEPLNIAVDHKGYFLSSSAEGFDILRAVNSPNVKLLYDIYHQQITEGNLIATITANIDLIGHFHVADVPGRHEPGSGEINYTNVFRAISETSYDRYVGLEFKPTGCHREALEAVKKFAGVA